MTDTPEPKPKSMMSTKLHRDVYVLVRKARDLVIDRGVDILPPAMREHVSTAAVDSMGRPRHPGLSDFVGIGARLLLAEIERVVPGAMPVNAKVGPSPWAASNAVTAAEELADLEREAREHTENPPTIRRTGRNTPGAKLAAKLTAESDAAHARTAPTEAEIERELAEAHARNEARDRANASKPKPARKHR